MSGANSPAARHRPGWPRNSHTFKTGHTRGAILDGTTDNTPAPTVWPCLSYTDEQAAIRFLVEAFGFEETLVVPGPSDGEIAHVEMRCSSGPPPLGPRSSEA